MMIRAFLSACILVLGIFSSSLSAGTSDFSIQLPRDWKKIPTEKKVRNPIFSAIFEKKGDDPLVLNIFSTETTGNIAFEQKAAFDGFSRQKEVLYCLERKTLRIQNRNVFESIYRLRDNRFASVYLLGADDKLWTLIFLYSSQANYADMKAIRQCLESFSVAERK